MPTILKTFIAAMLLFGLGGCVGAAGISTWDYRSGPGYESVRRQESRIQLDSVQGFTHKACRSESGQQLANSGDIAEDDLTACRSN